MAFIKPAHAPKRRAMSQTPYTPQSPGRTTSHSPRTPPPPHRQPPRPPPAMPSSTAHPSPPDSLARGRRGRQARPSQLSPAMHRAVRRFARAVGTPNVVPPAGFRDFRGWLAKLSARDSRPVWDSLVAAIARDVSCDLEAIHELKEDVVREIVKCVVIPRPEESAKLVSTNAGRQSSRPRSGTTLMVVLEQQLARVECKIPQLVADNSPISSSSSDDRQVEDVHMTSLESLPLSQAFASGSQPASFSNHRQRIAVSSSHKNNSSKLPSVSDILGERRPPSRTTLPSFKELDASLRKGHSSSSGRR